MKLSLEAKVGMFVIFCFLVLGYMTTKVGELGWLKGGTYNVKGYLKDAAGVTRDAFVKFKGVEVGKVKSIDKDIKLNKALWEMATTLKNIKLGQAT